VSRTPPITPPEVTLNPPTTITEERTYKIITPLFGGGVEPGTADPISLVRGSEVRGQLRFWWRATRGGQCSDLTALRNAEEAIWGGPARTHHGTSIGGQSKVVVAVEVQNHGRELRFVRAQGNGNQQVHLAHPRSLISYATFPLRQSEGSLRIGVTFRLTISFPADQESDVQSSLWAWESFGGLGARTRRGFGAIELIGRQRNGTTATVDGKPASADALEQWFTAQARSHVKGQQWHGDIPHLDPCRLPTTRRFPNGFMVGATDFKDWIEQALKDSGFTRPEAAKCSPALVAWYYPIYKLQQFRQQRRNNAGGRPFGRSYWPEPDEIRRRTPGNYGPHGTPYTYARKFPRAIFGLPIVFQFMDAFDPSDTTLQGRDHDRLSSRLILRPIACADGTYVAAATLLAGPALPPGGLQLKGARTPTPIDHTLTTSEATNPPFSQPLPLDASGNVDVIQAYLNTL
jgi:CRISPR-associated protein Cmr1